MSSSPGCLPSQTPFSIVPPPTHPAPLLDGVQTNPFPAYPKSFSKKSISQRRRQRTHHDNQDNPRTSGLYSTESDKSSEGCSLIHPIHRVIKTISSREGLKPSFAMRRPKCKNVRQKSSHVMMSRCILWHRRQSGGAAPKRPSCPRPRRPRRPRRPCRPCRPRRPRRPGPPRREYGA